MVESEGVVPRHAAILHPIVLGHLYFLPVAIEPRPPPRPRPLFPPTARDIGYPRFFPPIFVLPLCDHALWQPTMAHGHISRNIHSLPVELLTIILCIVSQMEPYHSSEDWPWNPPTGRDLVWYGKPILAVCRLWREIAFGCSAFWSRIPLTSLEWTKKALSLSRQSPIIIDTVDPRSLFFRRRLPVNATALALALRQLSRAEALIIKVRPSDTISLIRDRPAPLLRLCDIEGNFFVDGVLFADQPPVEIFAGQVLPRLQEVRVATFRLNSTCPLLLSSLSRLCLEDCGMVWNSITDMLGTLSHMPGLEEFHIERSLPPVARNFSRVTPFALASLHTLHLRGSCLQATATMQAIIIPTDCKITLHVAVHDDQPIDCLAALKSQLRDHYSRRGSSFVGFERLDIEDTCFVGPPCLHFNAYKDTSRVSRGFIAKPFLHVALRWHVPAQIRIACLTASGCVVPFIEGVAELGTTPNILCWRRTLPGLLSDLKRVVDLAIFRWYGCADSLAFPATLSHLPPDAVASDATQGFMFPRCQRIQLAFFALEESLHPRGTSMADVLLHDIADDGVLRQCDLGMLNCKLSQELARTIPDRFCLRAKHLAFDEETGSYAIRPGSAKGGPSNNLSPGASTSPATSLASKPHDPKSDLSTLVAPSVGAAPDPSAIISRMLFYFAVSLFCVLVFGMLGISRLSLTNQSEACCAGWPPT
ncbi:hypothetical protein OF83DRAFT_44540 [Amylostereum chailletii]|nr:hypothetical protein OF83DRAFT_44540 [Amylostereum chailletii]